MIADDVNMNYEYDKEGIFRSTIITPPGESTSWDIWMEYKYDELGNLAEVGDFTGMKSQYSYNKDGELSSISSNQGKVNINRNNFSANRRKLKTI